MPGAFELLHLILDVYTGRQVYSYMYRSLQETDALPACLLNTRERIHCPVTNAMRVTIFGVLVYSPSIAPPHFYPKMLI